MKDNIVLCGFMGCGKTSVGMRLAKLMGRKYFDMDKYIEKKAGMTITRIFAEQGETAFREMETEAVMDIAGTGNMVIASGGGTVLSQKNVDEFHKGGAFIVLLDVPLEVLQERLKNDTKRPLLQKPDRNKVIADLYTQRLPLYRQAADITVNGDASPWQVARNVAKISKNSR